MTLNSCDLVSPFITLGISISNELFIMMISISMIHVCHPPVMNLSRLVYTSAYWNNNYINVIITIWHAGQYINGQYISGSSHIVILTTCKSWINYIHASHTHKGHTNHINMQNRIRRFQHLILRGWKTYFPSRFWRWLLHPYKELLLLYKIRSRIALIRVTDQKL